MPQSWNFYERALYKKGVEKIAGIDEAGRGPLAGPVVAAACILNKNAVLNGIDDSKVLSISEREKLFLDITRKKALAWSFAWVPSNIIDKINILEATKLAMKEALKLLPIQPDFALIDAVLLENALCPTLSLIHGDGLSHSIAAASIIAKVLRDKIMSGIIHKKWPEYGFDQHKGYGTSLHKKQIQVHGLTPHHRKSFAPIKSALNF